MTILYVYEHGTTINWKSNCLEIRTSGNERSVPIEKVTCITLFGNIQLTTQTITALLIRGIPVTWLSKDGKFFGRLDSTSNINIFRQKKQFRCSDNLDFRLELSKLIVNAKILNQRTVLKRYNKVQQSPILEAAIEQLAKEAKLSQRSRTIHGLKGHEGIAARHYFNALSSMMPDEFSFKGRSRKPPKDKFNSLLSLGYTILLYDIYNAIVSKGLNPYAGFLHEDRERHPTLASDLMEEWRAIIIDSLILNMINRNMLESEDFGQMEQNGGILIGKQNIKIFLKEYESKIATKSKYIKSVPYELSYRMAFLEQSTQLTRALEAEDAALYEPIIIR